MNKTFQSVLLIPIFVSAIIIGTIASITVLFPAIIIRALGGLEDYSGINAFEIGVLAPYWIVVNVSVAILAVLYKKNKLPTFGRFVLFVTNFEISKKTALVAITIIIGAYASLSFHEIFEEEIYEDYKRHAKQQIESWQPSDITKGVSNHVKMILNYASNKIFGNYKVVPFLASISLLILTYYTTKEFAKKRFAGLVALVLVLQSGTFFIYDTSITYDNYWILFYLLSLYLIVKNWPTSVFSFVLSALSKGLSAVFLPMTFFVMYDSNVKRKNKIFLTTTYVGIAILGSIYLTNWFTIQAIQTSFDWHDFWMTLNGTSYQMRYDVVILSFLLPVLVWLFIAAKNGTRMSLSMIVLILGSLLSQPILAALTVNSSEPYRFVPFVVFFAMSCGVLFSKAKADEQVSNTP